MNENEKIPEGIPVEKKDLDLENYIDTTKKAGEWIEDNRGVFEFHRKEEAENLEKINELKQGLERLYEEKIDKNEVFLLNFKNLSEKDKNELRRSTGLSDSKLEELTQAVKEKNTKKIKIIQDSMKPMRAIDFAYQDELSEGEMRDEDGNLINKEWTPSKSRKKFKKNK